jgi:microcystin-dependent protein
MSEPFVGEIKIVGFNFAPRGWAFCDGQLLPISQNTALFSLLGTTYGGDGRSTFALPDLRGRSARHAGTGPGLANVRSGERGGAVSHTLITNNLPSHSHTMNLASSSEGEQTSPAGNSLAVSDDRNYVAGTGTPMGSTGNTGSQQAVNHLPPYLGVYHVIALQGLFPSRN